MAESMLLGWTASTWRKARDWARDTDLPAPWLFDERNFQHLANVRRKWIEAGGPMDGPCSGLDWSAK